MFKIYDTHNDYVVKLNQKEIVPYIKRCKENGVINICSSFFSSEMKESEIEERLNNLAPLVSKENFFLHIEDMRWVKDEQKLQNLIKLKPFSCSLTWNYKNALAGGNKDTSGLTDWGEHCVNELIKNGIVVDVAHLNQESFYDVIKIVKNNIFCSHTGFAGVVNEKRNLTDEQINEIIKSNGFIGLFFFDKCVKKNKNSEFTISDIVENIKYFTSRFGFDNLGLGTDFNGIDNYPKNLSDYSDFENLFDALKNEGFTNEQIDKIFYKNFEDFLKRINH